MVLLAAGMGTAHAGIWGHWPLNDGQGEDAVDLGPRGETGAIGNYDIGGLADDDGVWFEDPDRGMVASFNGNGDGAYVFAGYMPFVLTTEDDNDFTWSFWARQDEAQASPSNDIILGNRHNFAGGDTSPREFLKFTANRFEYHMEAGVLVEDNPDGTQSFLDDMQYLDCDFCPERHIPSDPSEWLHHTVVKDGANLTYYRNGEQWNMDEIETDQLSPDPFPIFFGGENTGAAGEMWRGFISDVWLFDEAISAAQVKQVMDGNFGSVPGDFNGDGQLTTEDIDDLTEKSASLANPTSHDLNNDALVNAEDVKVWIRDLYNSWVGDANLDHEFNSSDLVSVLSAGAYEVDTVAVWSTGDFNGDGRANSSDLVAALSDGGYEAGPRMAVAAVPEPSGMALTVLALLGLAGWKRPKPIA